MDIDYRFPPMGTPKSLLPTPALVIDLDRLEKNLTLLGNYYQDRAARLRPHFKTHKCPALARKQIEHGAIGITCAKLGEAEELVKAGIQSILIANQIVDGQKILRLAELARQSSIIVAVDQADNLRQLSQALCAMGTTVGIVIEVDVGLHRCGVMPGEAALELAKLASEMPGIHFSGVMGYEGHTVLEADEEKRIQGTKAAMDALVGTAELIRRAGIPVEIVTGGGTGTYNLTGSHPGVTEVEAGSYVFMDTQYRHLDLPFENSLSLLSTIISVPSSNRAVTDSGMKVLSSDNGLPAILRPGGLKLESLHEEHGLLSYQSDRIRPQVGDRVEFIPSHVCTTVNLHDYYYVVRNNELETIWPISGRGRAQ